MLGRVLAGRSPGHSLGETGRREAEAVAAALAGRPIVAVVSSPLERARETAAPIGARHGLRVEVDRDLDEIDFGVWTGLQFDALHADSGWQRFNVFRSSTPIPGGETMLGAQMRGLAALVRLRAAYPGGEVVVVSHGDVVKSILAHFLSTPLDLMRRIEISPASRSVLELGDRDARLLGINLPP